MFKKLILVTAIASAFNCLAAEDVNKTLKNSQLSISEKVKKIGESDLIRDEAGKIKFLVKIKSTESVSINKNSIRKRNNKLASLISDLEEPSSVDNNLMRNYDDRSKWASKESLASLKYLNENYKIQADLVLSVIDNVVSAYMTEGQAAELASDDLIEWVNPDRVIAISGYADGGNSNQILTWGLEATNTSTMGGGGVAYVADLTLSNIAMSDHAAMTRIYENQSYFDLASSYHPVYVTSIIGAKDNSQQARGISTGPIVHVSLLTQSESAIAAALEAAYVHADANNRFAPLNLSANSPNEFYDFNSNLHKWMSIASNRLMIAQSAGNNERNACDYAYLPQGSASASPVDGVMVVGAYDREGKRASFWPDGYGAKETIDGQWVGGSNAGACVDIWAPGKDIAVSTYADQAYFKNFPYTVINNIPFYDYNNVLNRGIMMAAGGTSFSAPFVTGVAARINTSNNIRPPQLESMLRATAAHTGSYDPNTGQAMMGVKYNSSASLYGINYAIPGMSLSSAVVAALTDGKYESIAWNSGSNNGEFTFASSPLKVVRFTPRGPGDDGTLNYQIQVINATTGAWTNILTASITTYDRVPVTVEIPAAYQSSNNYRIVFNKPNGGWIALSEFETYK